MDTISTGSVPLPQSLVGIGASAGGLEALRTLLSNLRPTGKLSFVVAQHLSPTYESMLRTLLERETTLTVLELISGTQPEADTVYITPPNTHVEYRQGRLVLFSAEQQLGPKPSINRFFNSLAEELGEKSIGIILSGTGADGTQGLLAMNQRGGTTIVQDPASAKYDGMPQAARHGLQVDYTLPVPAIAELLLSQAETGAELPVVEDASARSFTARVIELVKERTGFDLGAYKLTTLQRRIRRRMDRARLIDPEAYLSFLSNDRQEPTELAREILISVTEFFRDAASFTALAKAIHAMVESAPPQSTIRVWNPGCATGEEAYSIAMLFEEAFELTGKSRNYKIFATDIDEQALTRGRQGLFSAGAIATVPQALREKYFRELGATYTASKTLRDRILFSVHNLVTDAPFSRIDLVSCRNLLIYLTVPLQTQVFRLFHYALNPNGLLFLGQAESVDMHRDVFVDVDRDARLFRTMSTPSRTYHFTPRSTVASSLRTPLPPRQRPGNKYQDDLQQLLLRTLAPAGLVLNANDDVLYALGDVAPFVSLREGLVGTTVTALIHEELRAELRALLFKCRREVVTARGGRRPLPSGSVRLVVQPLSQTLNEPLGALTLVTFEPVADLPPLPAPGEPLSDPERLREVVVNLEQELSVTRQNLNTVVEELEHANEELQLLNEELQSTNEELQSANEELQTANEELQSTNEELLTVNDELQAKSRELEHAMADIQNVVESNTGPLIVVERDLRIRRFVKTVDCVIPVETIHIGDLITAVPWRVDLPTLRATISEVIRTGLPHEQILAVDARFFKLQTTAYRGLTGDIEGAVLWLADVTELEQTRRSLEESESYLSTIVDHIVDGIVIIDERGTVTTVNRAAERIFGYPQKDLAGRSVSVLMEPELGATHQGNIERYLATGEKRIIGSSRELRGRRRDGEVFALELGVSEITFRGTRQFCGVLRDISQRKQAEHEVSLLQQKAIATLECISDAIITLDEQGTVDYLNPVAEKILGVTLAQARGEALDSVYVVHDETTRERVIDILAGGTAEPHAGCLVLVDRQGAEHFIEQSLAPIRSAHPAGRQGTVIAFRDISAKRRMLEKITWQARHDPLTGLVNRVEFESRLERAVQSAKVFSRSHALLYLDLDQFKIINDTCGHRAGDDLLRQLAGHICVNLRARDTMARLGGDEFAAILENCTLAQGQLVATKLRESIQAYRFSYEGRVFKVGASIGVVEVTSEVHSAAEALSMADVACYAAKESGRNRVLVYTPDNAALVHQRSQMDWITRLNTAVDEHRLQIHFQPIKPLKNSLQRHWEVLVRMSEHDGSLVLPGVFLPAAERYGIISNIDRWVVAETLTLLRENFTTENTPNVSINLSAASLGEQTFHDFIREQLRTSRVNPKNICFEITETTAITCLAAVTQFMAEMKKLGCKFALDDFGSGMCSYGYLRTLPADFVKIDGVFVRDIKHDAVNLSLVESINRICQLLNLATIAECAEDEIIIEKLTHMGVDYVQGWGVGYPVSAADFLQRTVPSNQRPLGA
jgi:two-component system CheB/CheR fusion protein